MTAIGSYRHGLLLQPGPQHRVEPREPPERRVEATREDLPRSAGEPALEAGHQLAAGGELTGPVEDPAGEQARGVDVDEERAFALPPREGGQQLVLRLQHAPRVRQQPLAVRRQGHLPGRAYEEFGAQLPFQAPDVPAQGLLGDVHPGRGPSEVQLFGNGEKGAQEAGIEGRLQSGHHANLQPR